MTTAGTHARPKYWQAVNQALADEMARDESVVLFGQNTARSGGTFGSTRGLQQTFGELRVRDTPISEQASVGAAVGAAVFGLRPVIEIVFSDFLFIALDQVVNQAARIRYFSGGRMSVPLVIKAGIGISSGMGAQHAQSLEAWYAHIPGLKVVWGSDPASAGGLLRAAIRDPDPVVFFENVGRYTERGDAPDGEPIELGTAAVLRAGDDLTIITYGTAVPASLHAAGRLAEQGVQAEVIDLQTIQPWDQETVVASVRRTRRAVVVHDAVRTFGVGAEIASELNERLFGHLAAPVLRLGAPRTPAPQIREQEELVRPAAAEIAEAGLRLMQGRDGA